MAASSCVKCGNGAFELKSATPKGSRFALAFIQCASCGGVAGVMDHFNIGARINELEEKLDRIEGLLRRAPRG